MFQKLPSIFLLIFVSLFYSNTFMGDIEENRFGELINSDFKNLVNSNLPWCKKKIWGEGYKTDNCWTELAWSQQTGGLFDGYAGEWKNDEFHGKGVRIFPDRIIIGNWQANDISFGTIDYFDKHTFLVFYEGVKIDGHTERHYVFQYNNKKFIKDYYYDEFLLNGRNGLIKNLNERTFQYYGEIKDLQPHGKGEIRIQPIKNKLSQMIDYKYPYKITGSFKDGKLIGEARLFFKNNNETLPDVELDVTFLSDRFSVASVNEMKNYCGESVIFFTGNPILPWSDQHSHFSLIPVLPNQINSSKSKEIWQMAALDAGYIIKYDFEEFFIDVISNKSLEKIDKKLIQDLSINEKNQIFSADIKEIGAECYPNNAIDFNENKPSTIISSEGTYTGGVTKKYINDRNFDRYYIGYKKNGKGTIEYSDGSLFKGEWLNGMKDGYGEFIKKDGTVIKQKWVLGENSNQIIMQEKAEQKRLAQIEQEIVFQKGVNLELNPENLKKCEKFFNEYMKQFLFLRELNEYQYNLHESTAKEYLLNCLKDPNKYLYSF